MPIYDVENRFSYYKNYSDNILVGPPKPTMGSSVWQRSVSGSVVSGSEEYKAATNKSQYNFELESYFFRSGEVRHIRLQSNNQAILDSFVPDPYGLFATGSAPGSLVIYGGNILMYFSTDGNAITASNNSTINNRDFYNSYPFEKKYYEVTRFTSFLQTVYSISQNNFSNIYSNIFQSITSQTITLSSRFMIAGFTQRKNEIDSLTVLNSTDGGYYSGGSFFMDGSFAADDRTLFSLIFGFKPKLSNLVTAPAASGSYTLTRYYNCQGGGFKYGLVNILPTNFSCVFRQNHYGQPRDMLEGRIYTKTYNNPAIGGPLDEAGGINFVSGSALRGESDNWLTASIYQSKNVAAAYTVNPYGSGIFDKEYRASQPWFDNDPRLGT